MTKLFAFILCAYIRLASAFLAYCSNPNYKAIEIMEIQKVTQVFHMFIFNSHDLFKDAILHFCHSPPATLVRRTYMLHNVSFDSASGNYAICTIL